MKSLKTLLKGKKIVLLFLIISASPASSQNLFWAGQMIYTGTVVMLGIKADTAGNVFTLARLAVGTIDVDPGGGVTNVTSAGGNDIILCKYNEAGNFIWVKHFGGTGFDVGYQLTLDSVGNIYFCGEFENTVDFDPGIGVYNLISTGTTNGFVIKLDASGNLIWVKFNDVPVRNFKIDSSGNIFLGGTFGNTRDFDPSTGVFNMTSAGFHDSYISKLDPSGNFLWAIQIGGVDDDDIYSMDLDGYGDIYLTGTFNFNADFDPSPAQYYLTSLGNTDIFIEKISSSGSFVWAKAIGSIQQDGPHNIKCDSAGAVYISGYFRGTADFDPGVDTFSLTANVSDCFVAKLDLNGNFIWAKSFLGSTLFSSSTDGNIALNGTGDIFIAGSFAGTVDFDPETGVHNLLSAGAYDIYVCQLDSSGSFLRAMSVGSTDDDVANYLTVDASDNVYVTGNFKDTVDFDWGSGVFSLTSPNTIGSAYIMKTGLSTGINDIKSNEFFTTYPNPSHGKINIKFPNENMKSFSATLTNVYGERLRSFELNRNPSEFQMDVPPGIYFMTLQNNQERFTQKIIVQ